MYTHVLSDGIEPIAEGVTVQWHAGRRIVIFTIANVSTVAIDALVQRVGEIGQSWDRSAPCLQLYDLTHPDVCITPYMRERVTELNEHFPPLCGRIAVIVRNSHLTNSIKHFLMFNLPIRRGKTRELRFFFQRDDGLYWLSERLYDNVT